MSCAFHFIVANGIWALDPSQSLPLARYLTKHSLPMGSTFMDSTNYKLGISGRWKRRF